MLRRVVVGLACLTGLSASPFAGEQVPFLPQKTAAVASVDGTPQSWPG
jgi:hypothetical protein